MPGIDQVAYGTTPAPAGLNYGDNSRYFTLFHYVKRESTIRSPFVSAQQTTGNPMFLAPIFDPPLSDLPVGTTIDVRFRTSSLGLGTPGDTTSYVTPLEMVDTNKVLNTTQNMPFIQFQMVSEGNTSTQLSPVLDEVVIPFLRN